MPSNSAEYQRAYRAKKRAERDFLESSYREEGETFAAWNHAHAWEIVDAGGIEIRRCPLCGGKERRNVPTDDVRFNSQPFTGPIPKRH